MGSNSSHYVADLLHRVYEFKLGGEVFGILLITMVSFSN